MVLFMPKLQKSGKSFHIVLPNQDIRLLGWEKGQELVVNPHPTKNRALVIEEMPKKT